MHSNIKMPAAESDGAFVPTLNNMGYMVNYIDPYTHEFIRYSANISPSLPCLEIGAAYGNVTLEALKAGARIIANDLDLRHLQILEDRVDSSMAPRLRLLPGKFPDDINLKPQSVGAVFASRVFHFFAPEEFEQALKKIFDILTFSGKLFIICETPYLGGYEKFIPIFEKKKREEQEWPGLIEDVLLYNPKRGRFLPKLMHFFDADTLAKVILRHGFLVEKVSTFSRPDFPPDLQFDGRESVGLIALKPPQNGSNVK